MSRPRSAHVVEVKAALVARLLGSIVRSGDRFLSTRAVAQRFAVSYQTAHRLLGELEAEGLLNRRAASGSYVPGKIVALRGVQLIFHPRAKNKGSFGAHLLELLESALTKQGIAIIRSWHGPSSVPRLSSDYYPIAWECRAAIEAAAAARRFALCLNDRPPIGIGGRYIDAVTTDDFSGGACAAELLKESTGRTNGFAILGGPATDPRCIQRIAGFRANSVGARLFSANSWFVEGGRDRAAALVAAKPAGIFACNDRLAEALITFCRSRRHQLPPLVGFDNAPIAEQLRLTTIGIPWNTMVTEAVNFATQRVAGGSSAARLVILAHEPVHRLTT